MYPGVSTLRYDCEITLVSNQFLHLNVASLSYEGDTTQASFNIQIFAASNKQYQNNIIMIVITFTVFNPLTPGQIAHGPPLIPWAVFRNLSSMYPGVSILKKTWLWNYFGIQPIERNKTYYTIYNNLAINKP